MIRLTDRPDMTIYVYRGRKTTMQQQQQQIKHDTQWLSSTYDFGFPIGYEYKLLYLFHNALNHNSSSALPGHFTRTIPKE